MPEHTWYSRNMSPTNDAVTLRHAMVDALVAGKVICTEGVEAALRAVPRHLFAPWLSLPDAYSDRAWALPDRPADAPASISQPTFVAMMLESSRVQSGQRVLEIGAGTGYNAALLSHLVGGWGTVVTIDIEEQLVETARMRLNGYVNVQVIQGDGGHGYAPGMPYDRIVVTAGAWDLPPAWTEQLSSSGELILPLHLGGEPQDHELIAFRRQEGRVVGRGIGSVQMVLLRGAYANQGRAASVQTGSDWHGATADRLHINVYPHASDHEVQPHEVAIDKPSARLVLSQRDGSD